MNEIVKICRIHGNLTIDQVRKDGNIFRCKACRIETNKKTYYKHREKRIATSIRWKKQNRGDYNEWCRQDRKKNPDKYRKYEENYNKKHGIEKIRKYEVARIHGLTVEQYDEFLAKYDNKCAACFNPETRLGRDGKTVTPLCIDHCHYCESKGKYIIREPLCRSCNSALGHLKDNIDTMKRLISIIEKHVHVE